MKFVCRIGTVFTYRFWGSKEGKRASKRTNHGLLEGSDYLDVFLFSERGMCACKSAYDPVVQFSMEKMSQNLVKATVRKYETTESS